MNHERRHAPDGFGLYRLAEWLIVIGSASVVLAIVFGVLQ